MPLARPEKTFAISILHQKRMVASSVTNKPASQTLEHAATNVKEELGGTASDVAKIIAGANITTDSVSDAKGAESFVSTGFRPPGGITLRALIGTPVWYYGQKLACCSKADLDAWLNR